MDATPREALLVASYNIHRGVGLRGERDPERIARVIEEISPDVIALQEVDSKLDCSSPPGQLDVLQERLDAECVSGVTMRREDAGYGNAVFSRLPVRAVRRHDLSIAGREPRGAIDLDLEFRGTTVRFLATHFGLRASERRRQASRLSDILGAGASAPTLLVGDFNEWTLRGGSLAPLTRRFGRRRGPRTFPARRPLLRLDRIFAHPGEWDVDRLWAHRTALAALASDHLPLCARVRPRASC